ncbi:MAG: asparagine synthase (glutamine-hydrolyzing) [Bacteroidota bacterium]
MCGISGILQFNNQHIDPALLIAMSQAIEHRGPDDRGVWHHQSIGFAHQRLSIIDTSTSGHQPMHSDDGNYTIVYNGEIYNHQEFKDELIARGFTFRSSSDTEVLLYLYITYGAEMLHRLNGMFAFAIWDHRKNELFICRDRVGVKPLYYYKDLNRFCFASEPKAIFAAGIEKSMNLQNINEWLMYRYVSGTETLLKNIQKLLPGHYAIVKRDGSMTTTRWWNLSERINNHAAIPNPEEWFEETFHSSVKYRMVADVPVGVLLSGGLDSSSIAASLRHSGFENIHTFNVGFRNYENDETSIARKFSESLGFKFHGIHVEKTALFQSVIQSTIQYDEPLVHLNDPQILAISGVARNHVKALLSGEGADEILGGYVRYKVFRFIRYRGIMTSLLAITPERFKNTRIKKLERYLAHGTISELIMSNGANYFESDFSNIGLPHLSFPNHYRNDIITEASRLYPNNPERQLLYYDQHTYLQSLNDRNDRATMGASIECREPFMDYRLIEGVGTLDSKNLLRGAKGKHILLQTMRKHLPEYITQYKKVGFSVPWMSLIEESEELSYEYNQFLTSDVFEMIGLPSEATSKLLYFAKHKEANYNQLLLQLFFMYIWQKYYLGYHSNSFGHVV